jgi:electron transfer flavoprotein alpha subunit
VSGVLVLVEIVDGAPDRLSLEAVRFAAGLGSPLEAAVIGAPGVAAAAAGLGAYGVATVHVVEDERLSAYSAAVSASGLATIIDGGSFDAVIAPGSERGTEILAHIAARRGAPMAANVLDGHASAVGRQPARGRVPRRFAAVAVGGCACGGCRGAGGRRGECRGRVRLGGHHRG